jgi:riboflavin synthase
MFSGIVENRVSVLRIINGARALRLTLPNLWRDLREGQSVAVNGCCLTVARSTLKTITFDVIGETLARTNLGGLRENDWVNVERPLKVGDRVDGHFVQGHVDGVAKLIGVTKGKKETRLKLRAPQNLALYLIPKGSVTLDGVSLTIAWVSGALFEVALIPTTLKLTTLGSRKPGDLVNLEADIIAKTVVAMLGRGKRR